MVIQDRAARLGRIATRQHGVFTRQQALESGFTRGEVNGRIRRGAWEAVDYGLYRAAETPSSWHQRLMAACLAGPAVASHRSAVALWRLADLSFDVVEVTALRHRRRWNDDITWHESVRLDEAEVTELDRIPVTTPTRTLLDLGAVVDKDVLVRAIDDAVRRNLSSITRLQSEVERWDPRRRGVKPLRQALLLRADNHVPESPLESDFDELVRRYDLPHPSRQWVIRNHRGDFVARVDFAYPAARLAIELQSFRFHSDWQARLRDMQRENDLAAVDWRMLQFTAGDVRTRPDYVNATILRALRSGQALLSAPDAADLRNQ